MGITSRVCCCWDNVGVFNIDHFSIYKGKVGYVHRHIYSCSLTIGDEEIKGFEIEPTLGSNGQIMPFERIAAAVNAIVCNDWNSSLVIPMDDNFSWNDEPAVRYKGKADHRTENIQFQSRRWKEAGEYCVYTPKSPVWEQAESDEQLNKEEGFADRDDFCSYQAFDAYLCGLKREANVKLKFMNLGGKSTSEEIAREVLMDIIGSIVDCAENDEDKEWKEQLVKVFTFKLLLHEEHPKEADFSAGYSVTGSAKRIVDEWKKICDKNKSFRPKKF